MEEQTNVHIEWTLVDYSDNQFKATMMASGNYPDILANVFSVNQVAQYGAAGNLLPLEDYVDTVMPNFQIVLKEIPELRATCTNSDGHIYGLPRIIKSGTNDAAPIINKTWLKAVGKDIPTTIDEFVEVLRLFRDNDLNNNGDPNDEIPLGVCQPYIYTDIRHWMTPFNVDASPRNQFVCVRDGVVYFSPALPEYKDAVKWLRKLYQEKLLDQEAFTISSNAFIAKGKNPDMLLGAFCDFSGANIVGQERFDEHYTPFPPLKGPEGIQLWNEDRADYTTNAGNITDNAKDPELCARWLDLLYIPDHSIQVYWGSFGVVVEKVGEKQYRIIPPPEGMTDSEFRRANTICLEPHYIDMMNWLTPDYFETPYQKARFDGYRAVKDYFPKETFPAAMALSADEIETINNYYPDLSSYANQKLAEWVTGVSDIDVEWDLYIKELEALGLKEYETVKNNMYKSYLEVMAKSKK